ncbi:MAG: thioredoxin [Bacteroidia bacterium]|nr:MAG: thioredoxin [Bacteroidia bacterium]
MVIQGKVFSYPEYFEWATSLLDENKKNQYDEKLLGFIRLNIKRMERLNKTIELQNTLVDLLKKISKKMNWYIIAEPWCGDCAQIVPVLAKIAECSENIRLNIILRDENPSWIEKYHTNGSKSIPKLIVFDELGNELFVWGPRPSQAQAIFINWKQNPQGKTWDEFEKELHSWYSKDKTISIQNELYEKLFQVASMQLTSSHHD